MSVPQDRLAALERLPQFPAIATKVLRVLSQDEAGAGQIADLIRADAALSSALLQMVNSPLYSLRSQVNSIQQALMLVGVGEARRFVLAFSMKACFRAAFRLDLLRGIWRHSLACALVSEELAESCSIPEFGGDQAYTAGLLHDIGRLGMFVAYPEEYARLLTADSDDRPVRDQEQEAFGFDHCDAGEWLAARWGLPETIRFAAARHHDPPAAGTFDAQDLIRVAVLITGNLGFDIGVYPQPCGLQEIRALLPQAAQYRFDPDPRTMQARILYKLDAFD